MNIRGSQWRKPLINSYQSFGSSFFEQLKIFRKFFKQITVHPAWWRNFGDMVLLRATSSGCNAPLHHSLGGAWQLGLHFCARVCMCVSFPTKSSVRALKRVGGKWSPFRGAVWGKSRSSSQSKWTLLLRRVVIMEERGARAQPAQKHMGWDRDESSGWRNHTSGAAASAQTLSLQTCTRRFAEVWWMWTLLTHGASGRTWPFIAARALRGTDRTQTEREGEFNQSELILEHLNWCEKPK